MNIKSCEKKEKSTAELVVEIEADELDTAINEAYKKTKNRITVPGFRKGKAPKGVIERVYGASIFHSDALDILLPGVLAYVLKESGLHIIGYPDVTDLDFKDGAGGVDISMTATLMPEITLGQYKGLSAPKPDVEVADSEIDSEVESIRLRNARIEKADRALKEGDIAVIDYEGFLDGTPFDGGKDENHELEIGSGSFIPGFEDKLVGMAVGEVRDIDLVFPDNYADRLAGKPVVFKVKLNEVKEKQLPELDDEFAMDVSEFDTLADYKADIKGKLLADKQSEADLSYENALMDKVVEAVDAEIPDVMVEQQMDDSMQSLAQRVSTFGMDMAGYCRMMGVTQAVLRENMRSSSIRQVKGMLALSKIAELEGIEISEEEIEAEYKEISERYEMDIEKLKGDFSEDKIITDLKLRRAIKIVIYSATIDNSAPNEDKPADAAGAASPASPAKTKKSAAKKEASAKDDVADKPEKAGKAEKPEKPDKADKDKADKPETKGTEPAAKTAVPATAEAPPATEEQKKPAVKKSKKQGDESK